MINPDRLLQNLHRLREFGRTGPGVVRRCLTPVDLESRHWLIDQMQQAGLKAEIDGIGNVLGTSPNNDRALLLGSHSDTQPTGGWLDGALGVIYGLEVAWSLLEQETTRHLAVDIASWADEESHYLGMMGSRSFCGDLTDAEIDGARNEAGHPLRDALEEHGLNRLPRRQLNPARHIGYLEAHIEQGPWLERADLQIGVVTSIVGMADLTLTFHGQQNHAGTTPMSMRRDAAMALFEFSTRLNKTFSEIAGKHSVWTIGQVYVEPNARSIVPGQVQANLQFRDPEQERVGKMQQSTIDLVEQFNCEGDIDIEVSIFDDCAHAIDMDAQLQQILADAAEQVAPGKWQRMPSGAAHDAQIFAPHLPSGMLFIPSIDGISHDFAEDSREEDIVLGCEIMAQAVVNCLRAD